MTLDRFSYCALRAGALLLITAAVARADLATIGSAPWHVSAARVRVAIVPGTDQQWPRDAPTGCAQIYPAGIEVSNANIAVFTPSGLRVGAIAVWRSLGDPIRFLFDNATTSRFYYVYLADTAVPSGPVWKPMPGVMVETRTRADGPINSLSDFQDVWKKSARIQGRSCVPWIFSGGNPHGPVDSFAAWYRGCFTAKEAGTYGFATLSDDASFLLIDGTLVTQWPGVHDAGGGRQGQRSGTIKLAAGLHSIDYYHAQFGDQAIAEAAWQIPGSAAFEPMPRTAFNGVSPYTTQSAQSKQFASERIYFDWQPAAHSIASSTAFVTTRFTVRTPVAGYVCHWTFDDGSTATGSMVDHVFMQPGLRSVRLAVTKQNRLFITMIQPVNIQPSWGDSVYWRDDVYAQQRTNILNRSLAALPISDVVNALAIAAGADDIPFASALGEQCLQRSNDLHHAAADTLLSLAACYRNPEIRDYTRAEQCYRIAVQLSVSNPTTCARARLRLAGFLLNTAQGLDEASQLLLSFADWQLNPDDRRLRSMFEGDALLARGDVEGARSRYLAAGGSLREASTQRATQRRARLQSANDYLLRNEFDAAETLLRQLEWENPAERLGTETGLALVRVYVGRKEFPYALARCRNLLAVAVHENDRASLLYTMIELHRSMGQRATADTAYTQLLEQFPFSEAAARAKDQWGSTANTTKAGG